MCIFAFPVIKVSNTRIAVRPIGSTGQLTVYENQASTMGRNAMILPVPGGVCNLIDMTKFPRFWDECESIFPQQNIGHGASFSFGGGFGVAKEYIPVQRVGKYRCSFAASLEEVNRIDPNVFTLPPNIETMLKAQYPMGFGFLVCLFDGNVSHPIAYTHTRNGSDLFIPTMHEHGSGGKSRQLPSERSELGSCHCYCCDLPYLTHSLSL